MKLTSIQENKYILPYGLLLIIYDIYIRLIVKDFDLSRQFMISILLTLAYVSIFLFVLSLFSDRLKRFFIYLITPIIYVYVVAQDIHYTIFKNFLSFNHLILFGESMEQYNSILENIDLPVVLLFFISLGLLYSSNKKIRRRNIDSKNYKFSISLMVIALTAVYGARLFLVNEVEAKSLNYEQLTGLYDTKSYVKTFGLYTYATKDLSITLQNNDEINFIDEINRYFRNNRKEKDDNQYTNIFKDKNLVMIMAESFHSMAIHEELTPTLYKLKNEGIDFVNHHTPAYKRTTCDSEFVSQTGLVPSLSQGPTCYKFSSNMYKYSLPNMFNYKGYVTNSYHNNRGSYYGRDVLHYSYGFDNFYDSNSMGLDIESKWFDSKIIDNASVIQDDLFYSYIITLSGHSPYEEELAHINKHIDKVNKVVPEYEDIIKYYIAANMELDLMVEKLILELDKNDKLDETVIVIYGDHYPYNIDEESFKIFNDLDNYYEYHKIPFFIWSNNIEPKKVDTLTSTFDILPTISNMFGLNYNPTFYPGYDAFSENHKELIIFNDLSWYDGKNYYIHGGDNPNVNKEYAKHVNNYITELIKNGEYILISDYFRYIN